jgi:hypothetical protein
MVAQEVSSHPRLIRTLWVNELMSQLPSQYTSIQIIQTSGTEGCPCIPVAMQHGPVNSGMS